MKEEQIFPRKPSSRDKELSKKHIFNQIEEKSHFLKSIVRRGGR